MTPVMFERNRLLVNGLRTFWTAVALWYELGIFFNAVRNCPWPDSSLQPPGAHPYDHKPTHILIIADPQILDHHSYPGRAPYLTFLSRLVVDLNLRKAWRALLRRHPDAVVFLGDMMDGGRFSMSDGEYEQYYRRFRSIFKMDPSIPKYFLPGNHDTGLGVSPTFSADAHARYISHFGPLNQAISIANHTVIFLDAPGFVEEDSQRTGLGQTYFQWRPVHDGPIEFIKSFAEGARTNPVLFTHIPLSRPDDINCGPLRERGTIHRGIGLGYQNTLGKDATRFLLDKLRPSLIFSGDDHDYCEYVHTYSSAGAGPPGVREVTVKSISMAMGVRRPGFQLLSLIPPNARLDITLTATQADTLCLLPDQLGIYLSVYIPFLVLSLLTLLASNIVRTSRHRSGPLRSLVRAQNPDMSWVSSSPPANGDLRARLDVGDDSQELETYTSEESANPQYQLPRPASANITRSHNSHSRSPLSWSFVLFGRRRRITIGTGPRRLLSERILACRPGRKGVTGKWKRRGLVGGFIRDIKDVAVFPLTIFVLISWWMFSG